MPEQLSAIEAIMWRVGEDPTLRMTVGAVVVLDKAPQHDVLVERLAEAIDDAPRFRQLPYARGGRGRPGWYDEPDKATGRHVRSLSAPAPGSLRDVLELVGLVEALPFDPELSPWDVTVIDGVEGGKAVLYLRSHHVLTDGIGAVQLIGLLLDEPAWPQMLPQAPPVRYVPEPGAPAKPFGTVSLSFDWLAALKRVTEALESARGFSPVDTGVRGVQRSLDVANSMSRQLLVTDGRYTPATQNRSLLSHMEIVSIADARAIAKRLGGSRNDLLVAAVAAAFGRYHERRGERITDARVLMPASQRHASEIGGNWFAPARLVVPTVPARVGPSFGVVMERLAQARKEPALRLAQSAATIADRLPTRLLRPVLQGQADTVDFAATTVPGLRGERHICGSLIEVVYPFGPRLGCPMNVTAFGNDDRLDVGIALDPEVITEPEVFVECLREAVASLAAVVPDPSAAAAPPPPAAAAVPPPPAAAPAEKPLPTKPSRAATPAAEAPGGSPAAP